MFEVSMNIRRVVGADTLRDLLTLNFDLLTLESDHMAGH